MAKVLVTFTDDGRTGAIPYTLSIIEHRKALSRYQVVCMMANMSVPAWQEAFTTFTGAADRFIDELRVMARDFDDHQEAGR